MEKNLFPSPQNHQQWKDKRKQKCGYQNGGSFFIVSPGMRHLGYIHTLLKNIFLILVSSKFEIRR